MWGRGQGNCANGINSSLQKEKKVKSLSHVQLFATLWTSVAYQAPLSHGWDFPDKSPGVGCQLNPWKIRLVAMSSQGRVLPTLS